MGATEVLVEALQIVREERRNALEDAAKACDGLAERVSSRLVDHLSNERITAYRNAALAIRDLKQRITEGPAS